MDGKVAFVTGAAGGIGKEVVRVLAERGAAVAAVDLDAEELHTTADKLNADGLRVLALPGDVTSSSEVNALVDEAENRLGPLDHLANAAGVLRLRDATMLSDEDWAATFAVNTTGVFYVSRAVVDRMARRGGGSVVTVASNAAGTPRTQMAAYSASKAAATMFTKCLGLEVAGRGVRCNVVAPGSTRTSMLTSMWEAGVGEEAGARASVEGVPEAFRVGIPLGRLADPVDVARTVAFLLSDEASHITLHSLTVDGGAALGV